MKRYSFKLPLALFLVMLILGSCGPMMYTYYETGYDGTEVVPDTSEWWLKPIYLRTDTASPDSLELKQFVHFHDDEEGVTYIKVSGDNSILFEPRSADINMDALKELFFIAALLSDKPFSEMIIYGSADNTESRDYSMELSEERAETVAEYFMSLGFTPDVMQIVGLGDTDPASFENTIEGRALNRYVDVFITVVDN